MMGTKRKNIGMAFLAIFMLLGMALLGFYIPDEVSGDSVIDNHLVSDVSLDPAWVYNTSTVDVNITYTLAPVVNDLVLSNLTITYREAGSVTVPVVIYSWNLTSDGGIPDNPYVWSLTGALLVGVYVVNVTADYYNGTSGANHIGSHESHFEVIDGTPVIEYARSDVNVVDNSGNDRVNISLKFNRNFDEMDVDNEEFALKFFNDNTGKWADGDVMDLPEPAPENITEGLHNVTIFSVMVVPFDFPVGHYRIFIHAVDIWGYTETYNETLFSIVWRELPPEMSNGTVYMHEDGFTVVDLDDHFTDINGQDLTYYINLSAVENLTISWVDDNTINISAPADWNGQQTFEIAVSDGIDMPGHNATFIMTVIVEPVPDEMRMAENTVIMISEEDMEAEFNPQNLFYDPDGPISQLTVSLGWEWAVNETNVSYMKPLLNWTNGNFSVSINESDNTDGMALMLEDLEGGSTGFPVSAWVNGTFIMNGTATLEIQEVNDVPAPNVENIQLFKNEPKTFNLSALFDDPDGPSFNASVDTNVSNIVVTYDWMTYALSINPSTNWTGTVDLEINVTDGVDYAVYTIPVNVILRSYTITGAVVFEAVEGVNTTLDNVTLTIGGNNVEINLTTGAFQMVLSEGEYAVTLSVPAELLYDEAGKSGYVIPALENISLAANVTYNINLAYRVYESPIPSATWADIDFTSKNIVDKDGVIEITIGVANDTYSGYGDIPLVLVIVGSDDKEYSFNMTWDATSHNYTLELNEDNLTGVPEGERDYYFTDGSNETEKAGYEFKAKDENAPLVTVIVLIVLIILVLIALVFIMRKPSEEEFDEDEEEGEESGERVCPACGETITDENATECPYCGESLEEE